MTNLPDKLENRVGLFFVVNEELLLHSCTLEEAELYGIFANYPLSHDKVWRTKYQRKFGVDFDYFPRGRIVYNKEKQLYLLYYDSCIEEEAKQMQKLFPEGRCILSRDEHYQCHSCNHGYVI